MIRHIQQGLLAEGVAVSIAKLCAWFGISRWTVYYKLVKAAPKADPCFSEPIKKMIGEELSFGCRTVAWLLGFNKNTVNGGAKVGHGGGAKPGQLVRVCAMVRALLP